MGERIGPTARSKIRDRARVNVRTLNNTINTINTMIILWTFSIDVG